jgi:hypothetical protein
MAMAACWSELGRWADALAGYEEAERIARRWLTEQGLAPPDPVAKEIKEMRAELESIAQKRVKLVAIVNAGGPDMEKEMEELKVLDVAARGITKVLQGRLSTSRDEWQAEQQARCTLKAVNMCLSPDYRLHRHAAAALCHLELLELDACAEQLEVVVDLQPDNAIAVDLLAHWYGTHQGDKERARPFEERIKHAKDKGECYPRPGRMLRAAVPAMGLSHNCPRNACLGAENGPPQNRTSTR